MQPSRGFDLPQHGRDLAVAPGQDATIDPGEASSSEVPSTATRTPGDWQRAGGWYRTPVAVPEDAALQDRVLGLIGRDPLRRPPA